MLTVDFVQQFSRYGRRFAFFVILFMATSLSIAIAFSPNYIVYTVLRTINGLTFPALFQIPFILCEFKSRQKRKACAVCN